MRSQALGALLGLSCAAGLLLAVTWLLSRRRPSIADRIRPSVTGDPARPAPTTLASVLSAAVRRVAPVSRRGDARPGGGDDRLEQAAWTAGVGCAGGVAGLLAAGPTVAVVLAASGGVAGILLCGRRRAARARRRRLRMEQHLPAAVELVAFSVSAGESVFGALARTASSLTGDLADELNAVVADVHGGVSLESALRRMGTRTGSEPVSAFVDFLVMALERGTPLADGLRAQAAELQASARRRLMEQAGRKDVAMLVPVVFLILPTVVAVAIFPGLQSLHMVVP